MIVILARLFDLQHMLLELVFGALQLLVRALVMRAVMPLPRQMTLQLLDFLLSICHLSLSFLDPRRLDGASLLSFSSRPRCLAARFLQFSCHWGYALSRCVRAARSMALMK
jgi:hypothetical protein